MKTLRSKKTRTAFETKHDWQNVSGSKGGLEDKKREREKERRAAVFGGEQGCPEPRGHGRTDTQSTERRFSHRSSVLIVLLAPPPGLLGSDGRVLLPHRDYTGSRAHSY
ncbi:hypothetical protein CDAR_406331 [Caerostris darwini]|uniref:Uncharacterized protein n=1 Tax=Caerostris darwini TaxID=1538125 RepID=A0AAV4MUV5_9ARAC|nr:hypothetical protein CDAR_406331 [Caerostris darwini]